MSTISVIIPVYNTERYLRRCLDSIVNQTYGDWEALCVNDGSPDGSRAILQEYADRDQRFKIIDKPNGGLSDARNAGLDAATGEYINFVDSDDLIHPQTFEIALALARRDGSDIVSWYKASLFRRLLRMKYRLGGDIDNSVPWSINRRFHLDRVKSIVTDNVFAHAAEDSTFRIAHPIKHFYAWRHLIRREFHGGVRFVKGILYEDFPWWSEVMLLNPRVTITQLPFYYYFPNPASIDLGSTIARKTKYWLIGLEYAWRLYEERATEEQRTLWSRQCKWPVIKYMISNEPAKVDDAASRQELRGKIEKLWELGVFSDPFDKKTLQAQQRLKLFIEQKEG